MRKLLIANWKSNPDTAKTAIALAKATDKRGVVIAPPHIFLEHVAKTLKKAELGAQDVFGVKSGPYTGETSLNQLKSLGVKYIILGHSERRKYLKESDELIAKKVKAALEASFKVVLCVGEPKRELGSKNYELRMAQKYVKRQLEKDLKGIHNSLFNPSTGGLNSRLIVAYEPVWAISTFKGTRPDTPEGASEMIGFIKQILNSKFHILNSRVLYGGSVNARNAKAFLSQRVIDGALIGGASLRSLEFNKIINGII